MTEQGIPRGTVAHGGDTVKQRNNKSHGAVEEN